jgi:unspecific monooxygenase
VAPKARRARFNPFDPEYVQDPYPTYRSLRDAKPVHRTPFGPMVVTRHADVAALLKDSRFGVDARRSNRWAGYTAANAAAADAGEILDRLRPFIFLDPPEHTRLRRLVSKAFTPRAVEQMRQYVSEVVAEMLARAREKDCLEVIGDLADPLPTRVVSEMLGVPRSDHEMVRNWTRDLNAVVQFNLLPETDPHLLSTLDDAVRYLRQLVHARQEEPTTDLLSSLVAASHEANILTVEEVIATCIMLLVAGQDTTVNLIGNGLRALAQNPGTVAALRADPALWPQAVEELLRFDSPVQMTSRIALADAEVADVPVAPGQELLAVLGSANRDERVFEDPDHLDLQRKNAHLAFGLGAHSCIGASLGRLEGGMAISCVTGALATLELVEEPHYRGNFVLRGLEALKFRW